MYDMVFCFIVCMIKLYKTNGEDIIDYHTVRD